MDSEEVIGALTQTMGPEEALTNLLNICDLMRRNIISMRAAFRAVNHIPDSNEDD